MEVETEIRGHSSDRGSRVGNILHGLQIPFGGHFLSLNQGLLLTFAARRAGTRARAPFRFPREPESWLLFSRRFRPQANACFRCWRSVSRRCSIPREFLFSDSNLSRRNRGDAALVRLGIHPAGPERLRDFRKRSFRRDRETLARGRPRLRNRCPLGYLDSSWNYRVEGGHRGSDWESGPGERVAPPKKPMWRGCSRSGMGGAAGDRVAKSPLRGRSGTCCSPGS